jgi:hypothetical protein
MTLTGVSQVLKFQFCFPSVNKRGRLEGAALLQLSLGSGKTFFSGKQGLILSGCFPSFPSSSVRKGSLKALHCTNLLVFLKEKAMTGHGLL